MSRFMLDTNSVTYALRGNKQMLLQLSWHPVESMFLSCVSEGEIIYGLGLLPGSHKLHSAVAELLQRLHILPWNSATAQTYGQMRVDLHLAGKRVAPLDMMIAAHALDAGAILVTSDKAFRQVPGLLVEDWTV